MKHFKAVYTRKETIIVKNDGTCSKRCPCCFIEKGHYVCHWIAGFKITLDRSGEVKRHGWCIDMEKEGFIDA